MMTLTHSTRIAVNVLIDDDTGAAAALIVAIAALVTVLVQLGQFINEVILFAGDLVEAFHLTNAIFEIGFKALAFGLGIRL